MTSRILSLFTLVALCLLASPAFAYPYKLYAKYQTNRSDAKATPTYDVIELPAFDPRAGAAVAPRTFVPTAPVGARLVGLFIAPKADDIAKAELDRLDAVFVDVFDASDGDRRVGHEKLTKKELSGDGAKPIPITLKKPGISNEVYVRVLLHFEANFLCEKELELRAASPAALQIKAPDKASAPITLGKGGPQFDLDATNAGILLTHSGKVDLLSYATLFQRGLKTARGEPIIFSYCTSVHNDINWVAYAKLLTDNKEPITDKELHAREKKKLADLILARLGALGGYGNIHLEKYSDNDDEREHTYGEFRHYASFLRNLKHLAFKEYGSETRKLGTVIDKASVLLVTVDPDICSEIEDCHGIISEKLSVEATFTNAEGKSTTSAAPLTPTGDGYLISSELEKHIKEKLSLSVYYTLDNGGRLTLLKTPTVSTVENIGFVTTFPVASEVVASLNGIASEPNNMSARSTVPVSYAFERGGNHTKGAAVTFPWMMGVNPRWSPRLSEYLSAFAHLSIVVPTTTDSGSSTTTPMVAAGVGVAVAKVFTFSVGWPVKGSDAGDTFLFVGVSAPELADTLKLGK